MSELKNTVISDTAAIQIASGTTAQRPDTPIEGMIRYNTTIGDTEYYDGGAWRPISDVNPEATGGTIADTEIGGVPYRIHFFTTVGNSTFTVTRPGEVEYLIVAGGGGGGDTSGGGGGAGGVVTGKTKVTSQSYTISVGAGGVGSDAYSSGTSGNGGTRGGDSSALNFTALGGGGGGSYRNPGQTISGGSGGGSRGDAQNRGYTVRPGLGLQPSSSSGGYGNNGGNTPGLTNGAPSAGGGGAGEVGQDCSTIKGGNGGNGIRSLITGIPTFYAGGGGGSGGYESGGGGSERNGIGGLGGGGTGGRLSRFIDDPSIEDGTPNTGGGGGGNGYNGGGHVAGTKGGANGGSGIVIIRYRRNNSISTSPDGIIKSSLPLSIPARSNFVEPGRHYYNMLTTTTGVVHYILTTPFDIDTRIEVGRKSPSNDGVSGISRSDNMAISNDGRQLYICATRSVLYYTLSVPFNVTSATLQWRLDNFHSATEPTCFQFADNGKKFYTHFGTGGEIIQYELTIPYDIRTRVETARLGGFPNWGPGDPAFSPDGYNVAFGRRGGNIIRGGICTKPFDLDTYTETATITSTDADPSCCKWNGDGTLLYARHASPDMVNEWNTPTPYSLIGATFSRQVTASTAFTAGGLDFNYNH